LVIPLEAVQEMVSMPPVTAVPRVPPYVRGVINLRGSVVPLIDLRVMLGVQSLQDQFAGIDALLAARLEGHKRWIGELEVSVKESRPFKLALGHHVTAQLAAVNTGYRRKAQAVRAWIDEHLGGDLAGCTGGSGGFYYYLTFRDVETHPRSAFFRFLARATGEPALDGPPGRRNPRVIYIPGEYCVHPRGDLVALGRRQLRLSYGFEELANIKRAIVMMKEAVAYARAKGVGCEVRQ
jgi:DNA-binding transcriptional MocR family regulator